MPTADVLNISITVEREWRAPYDFAHRPGNFPRWASGLASGLRQVDGDWVAEGPGGEVRIRFAPPNPFGVLDHVVVTGEGLTAAVPMRIVANGSGCEVLFTLFRQHGMDDARFASDADWIRRDLRTLKSILEPE